MGKKIFTILHSKTVFICIEYLGMIHLIVGEPKSPIVQKHIFLHSKVVRLEFRILVVLIVLDMKPLYSNATRIAFRGKCIFFVYLIGQVKQSFIA